jgi:hypothetical protein
MVAAAVVIPTRRMPSVKARNSWVTSKRAEARSDESADTRRPSLVSMSVIRVKDFNNWCQFGATESLASASRLIHLAPR